VGSRNKNSDIGGWLRHYDRKWLRKDLVGGVTAGAIVIPQAMAYATIANLPVEVGLYTCMVPMAVYALMGGSRSLSVSTTSTIATLTASTILGASVASSSDDPLRTLATLTLLVGVILFAVRLLRLGGLVDSISEATLVGIKAGVGLTVAAGQLPKLLGIPGDPTATNFFQQMRGVIDGFGDLSWVTVAFSAATLVVLFILGRVAKSVPAPLVAVIGGILLVEIASLDEHGLAVVGSVPSGLPTPIAPSWDHWTALLPGAFAIALMCFLETVSVARSVRRPSEPPIDNDQELIASSFACIGGAFFRAMPSAGGFSQTAINQRAGAQTQLSELVTVLLAVMCALFLGGLLGDLPQATLGCLVVVAVLGLIKPAEFSRMWRLSRLEFSVAAVTAVSGLVFGLLVAVLVGVLLTLFLVIHELNHVGVTELQLTRDGSDVQVADQDTVPTPGLRILRVDAPLYAANVRTANRNLLAALDRDPASILILDISAIARVPLAVVDEFRELQRELAMRETEVWFASVPPKTLAMARQLPSWNDIEGSGRYFTTVLSAARAYLAARSLGGA
jgi:sulfate permease, SulP family